MTRRMQANTHPNVSSFHYKEHDEAEYCNTHPKCRPVVDTEPSTPFNVAGTRSYDPPPTHYATERGIDPWAVWDAFDLDRYTANAVKYLLRAGKKDIAPRLDDLQKASNYVAKAIEMELKRERTSGS